MLQWLVSRPVSLPFYSDNTETEVICKSYYGHQTNKQFNHKETLTLLVLNKSHWLSYTETLSQVCKGQMNSHKNKCVCTSTQWSQPNITSKGLWHKSMIRNPFSITFILHTDTFNFTCRKLLFLNTAKSICIFVWIFYHKQ